MATLESLQKRYKQVVAQGRMLDIARGKPSPEQLELSSALLGPSRSQSVGGVECRNYGVVDGLLEARELFADILQVPFESVVMGGNSSLALMHDIFVQGLLRGMVEHPWRMHDEEPVWLCLVPGYDRHFDICQYYNVKMCSVPLVDGGPVMDIVEELVARLNVVGMWCVPTYSNSSGVTYSDRVIERLARMETRNPGFRIFCDDAYAVHHLYTTDASAGERHRLFAACEAANRPERAIIFGSTPKMTFAGSGIAAVSLGPRTRKWYLQSRVVQTIGPDKLNELRHVNFLRDIGIRTLMGQHADLLRSKFEAVHEELDYELGQTRGASWTRPRGGYFITLYVLPGCARRVVQLAKEAGVTLTPAGATHPYGYDPQDTVIRIAPSFPSVEEIRAAMRVVALCVKLATAEKELMR